MKKNCKLKILFIRLYICVLHCASVNHKKRVMIKEVSWKEKFTYIVEWWGCRV